MGDFHDTYYGYVDNPDSPIYREDKEDDPEDLGSDDWRPSPLERGRPEE
jgi:hypothetical protein